MTKLIYEVPPLSSANIEEVAEVLRSRVSALEGLGGSPYFPVMTLLETYLPRMFPDLPVFGVVEKEDMPLFEGLTHLGSGLIELRSDVYEGAHQGHGRPRFTVAHEIGHLLLHAQREVMPRRVPDSEKVASFRCSEWQADYFAGALLMPRDFVLASGKPHEIAAKCGVTLGAANVRLYKVQKNKKPGP